MKCVNTILIAIGFILLCGVILLLFRYKIVSENNHVYIYDICTNKMSIYSPKGKIFPIIGNAENKYENLKKDVSVTAKYNLSLCSKEFPIEVLIVNGSKERVLRTEWRLDVNKKGTSDSLDKKDGELVPHYIGNKYLNTFILEPMENFSACYKLPPMINSFDEKDMVIRTYEITPTFANTFGGDLDTMSRF